MKTYRGSVQFLLGSSVISTMICGMQIIINVHYERMGPILLFTIFTVGFLAFTFLLSIDLMTKDTRTIKVTVLEIDERNIKVLKPNGKKRRIRLLTSDMDKYEVNQQLQLTLTKITGQILDINH